jgi:hypothetical protein
VRSVSACRPIVTLAVEFRWQFVAGFALMVRIAAAKLLKSLTVNAVLACSIADPLFVSSACRR